MQFQDGKLVKEGKRAILPADLSPGDSVTVELAVNAPDTPGVYTLRIEPVQEGVSWFSDNGGCKSETKVRVISQTGHLRNRAPG